MESNANDEIDRLKSHLEVYEGLLRDKAAEIALLTAENAYLKKKLQQNPTAAAQAQEANPRAGQVRRKNLELYTIKLMAESHRHRLGMSPHLYQHQTRLLRRLLGARIIHLLSTNLTKKLNLTDLQLASNPE